MAAIVCIADVVLRTPASDNISVVTHVLNGTEYFARKPPKDEQKAGEHGHAHGPGEEHGHSHGDEEDRGHAHGPGDHGHAHGPGAHAHGGPAPAKVTSSFAN